MLGQWTPEVLQSQKVFRIQRNTQQTRMEKMENNSFARQLPGSVTQRRTLALSPYTALLAEVIQTEAGQTSSFVLKSSESGMKRDPPRFIDRPFVSGFSCAQLSNF